MKLRVYNSSDITSMNIQRIVLLAIAAIAVLTLVPTFVEGQGLRDLPSRAIARSQITLPGSRAFHLKATVFEQTNKKNDGYNADIEEDWAAPNKWRRTVTTKSFSETVVVNDDKTSAQISGDYEPLWLRTLVNAIFAPGVPLEGVDLTKSRDNPVVSRSGDSLICRRFGYRVGIALATNTVFTAYCFQGGLLQSVVKPGYMADYARYKKFDDRQVARRVTEDLEPGTILEADIVDLEELTTPDESLFKTEQASRPLRSVALNEQTFRTLILSAPDIQWPTIKDGKAIGTLSLYVSVDRQGNVRETYGLNSDNPYMTDAARKQIMNWKFKRATNNGEAVQIESILTFAYQTQIEPREGSSLELH